MHVAYVSAHYDPFIGGVEKHILEIAKRVAKRGHDVSVLTQQEAGADLAVEEMREGVKVKRFSVPVASRNYAVAPGLWRHLARSGTRYDVIHAHGYHALPALAAAMTRHRALVFTPHYHGTGHSRFRKLLHPPYRRLGRLIFERAQRTIAVSPPEAELILSHFPSVRSTLEVIPNGVDREKIDAATPFDADRTVVLCAGRLETYKQVDKVIGAMESLPNDFILRITGDGPARPELEAQLDSLDLRGRVQLLGRVDETDLYRWFRTARIYVNLSSNEAMPVTMIECLAAGACVVASDIPAHRDLVRKTRGAITLVPLGAGPDEVASAIRSSSETDPGEPSIDTWDDIVDRTIEVYSAVAASVPA